MNYNKKVFEAFRNCITKPKCKDCPWEQCEQLGNRKVEIPIDLALDVLNILEKNKEWIPFKFRPMTNEEVEHYNEYYGEGQFENIMVENTPADGEDVLVSYDGFVFLDTFCADNDGVGFEKCDEVEDGMAWMPLPKPYNPKEKL